MAHHAPPPDVAPAYDAMPEATRRCALAMRALVLDAANGAGVAPLQETLKWGEPAYLPGRAGTTVRIGWDKASGRCKLLVNCRTTLVERWRSQFGDRLAYEGNRAVVVDPAAPLDRPALAACVAGALTYHRAAREVAHG